MLRIDGTPDCQVTLNNVNVTYSQNLDARRMERTTFDECHPPDSIITITSQEAYVEMSDVIVTADIQCQSDAIASNVLFYQYMPLPFCRPPITFFFNRGTAQLKDVQFHSDYDISSFVEPDGTNCTDFRYYFSDYCSFWNSGIYFMRYLFLDESSFYDESDPFFAAIYNENKGLLNITNLYFGIGAHFSLLYNRGTASIHGLHTEFSQNDSAYYDRWNLRPRTVITNYFGSFHIFDSDIVGADMSLVDIYGGTVDLHNVTLAQSMLGITTYYFAESISMDTVNLYEIGKFYSSLGAATYYVAREQNIEGKVDFFAPCHLAADSVIIIKNSSFSYLDPSGVLKFAETGILDEDTHPIGSGSLQMMDNIFKLTLQPDDGYDGYLYRSDYSAFRSMLNQSYGIGERKNRLEYAKAFVTKQAQSTAGYIVIENRYQFVIGNNEFLADSQLRGNLSDYKVHPRLYIDSGFAAGCIAGNTLKNMDLVIHSGNVRSCNHPDFNQSQEYNRQCRLDLGVSVEDYGLSQLLDASVVIDDGVDIVLEDIFITSSTDELQLTAQTSKIALFDVVIDDGLDIVLPSFCNIDCLQLFDTDQSMIRCLIIDCDAFQNQKASQSLISIRNYSEFVSLTADRVILNNESESAVYPGGYIPFSFSIVDRHGQIVDDYASNISMTLINEEININSRALISSGGVCSLSETGIYVQGINIDDVDKTYNITVRILDNFDGLSTNNLTVKVIPCPSGFGVLGAAKQCVECSKGLYSITPTIDQCSECNTEDMRGVECLGGNSISVLYNHWMEIEEDGRIVSSDCPNQYCCQKQDGCDYVMDSAALCALHRDSTVPLCGKCERGYSEKLGTVNCGICTRNRYELFLIPLALCAMFSCYLLCFDKRASTRLDSPELTSSEENVVITGSEVIWDDFKGLRTMVLNVLLYYGQGLVTIMGQSTIQSGIFYFMLPILQIFNLSFDFGVNSNAENAGWCIIKGLTAAQEILLYLFIPALLLFITGFMAATYFCGVDWLNLKWCFCRFLKPYCPEITYYSAFLRALIISIGSIMAVIFKILSCRDIAGSDITVHYYYGDTECFDWHWFVALSALFVLLGIWIILDVVSWRQSPESRQNPDENHLFAFINSYQPRYVAMIKCILSLSHALTSKILCIV